MSLFMLQNYHDYITSGLNKCYDCVTKQLSEVNNQELREKLNYFIPLLLFFINFATELLTHLL